MSHLTFQSLASSSAGNAYVVSDGRSRLLLECGVPYRRLQKLLGFRTSGLCGCLVSHEHKDHAKCAGELVKNGVRVCASGGTCEALGLEGLEELPVDGGGRYVPFRVGTFDVLPFETFHDAAEPVGFLIRSGGEKLVFATDTVNLRYRFPGASILAVECNHSAELLARCAKMPDKVVRRITNSHMEVRRLCGWLAGLELEECREIYLLHLSDACSDAGECVELVRRCVPRGVRVTACAK